MTRKENGLQSRDFASTESAARYINWLNGGTGIYPEDGFD
jgi:hypothetical protein